jgi:flagellar biosynthetic protein FlhB
MAEDQDESQKTEQPTAKRLQEARKKGDVVKSAEVSGVIVLAAATALLAGLSGNVGANVSRLLAEYLASAGQLDASAFTNRAFWQRLAGGVALAVAAPILALLVVAVSSHIVQAGWLVSPERLKPNLNKLSPLSGAKRLFGASAAANIGKGLAKMVIIGSAAAASLWPRRDDLLRTVGVDAGAILPIARNAAVAMLIAAIAVYIVLAIVDYVGQKLAFTKRQRMTRQEVKDEHKQIEGDPKVRARLRQIRMERAQRRMMAAVPSATVVVTNPTHYAVALRYAQGETPAPICVAKGVDAVALKIREIAEEHGVPIMEDPPLARVLFSTVEIDQPIPPDHYQAVAKIIGYVFTLAKRRRR